MRPVYLTICTEAELEVIAAWPVVQRVANNWVFVVVSEKSGGKLNNLPPDFVVLDVAGIGVDRFASKAFFWSLEELRAYVALKALAYFARKDVPLALVPTAAVGAQVNAFPSGNTINIHHLEKSLGEGTVMPCDVGAALDLGKAILAIGRGPVLTAFFEGCCERLETAYRMAVNVSGPREKGRLAAFYREWVAYAPAFGIGLVQVGKDGVMLPDMKGLPDLKAPYQYFSDDTPIFPPLRAYYMLDYRLRLAAGSDPFGARTKFTDDSVVPGDGPTSPPLTAVAYSIWLFRPDLQQAFPKPKQEGRRAYLEWFIQYGAKEYGLDKPYVQPVIDALSNIPVPPSSVSMLERVKRRIAPDRDDRVLAAELPKGINLCGHIRGEYGIGEATRKMADCLAAGEIPFGVVDFASEDNFRYTNETWLRAITNEFTYNTNLLHTNADGLNAFRAEVAPEAFAGRYNIGYWVWELPEFPVEWHGRFAGLDEIWTPSDFSAEAIRACSPVPVYTFAHSVEPGALEPGVGRATFGLPEEAFLFLTMFDVRSHVERKNPMGSVHAFCEAFPQDDDTVGLVVKINAPDDWRPDDELAKILKQKRNIHLLRSYMERPVLNALMVATDAFVSLHRSEGFGFAPAEAMYWGRPAILTDWSGNRDYMREGACCPVGYELVTLTQDYGPYKKGMHWAEPNVQEAARYMRRMVADAAWRDGLAKSGKELILREFSSKAIGDKIRRHLKEKALL